MDEQRLGGQFVGAVWYVALGSRQALVAGLYASSAIVASLSNVSAKSLSNSSRTLFGNLSTFVRVRLLDSPQARYARTPGWEPHGTGECVSRAAVTGGSRLPG